MNITLETMLLKTQETNRLVDYVVYYHLAKNRADTDWRSFDEDRAHELFDELSGEEQFLLTLMGLAPAARKSKDDVSSTTTEGGDTTDHSRTQNIGLGIVSKPPAHNNVIEFRAGCPDGACEVAHKLYQGSRIAYSESEWLDACATFLTEQLRHWAGMGPHPGEFERATFCTRCGKRLV